MDDNEQTSCWGLTAKAVFVFVAVMALTWLVSGANAGLELAAAG